MSVLVWSLKKPYQHYHLDTDLKKPAAVHIQNPLLREVLLQEHLLRLILHIQQQAVQIDLLSRKRECMYRELIENERILTKHLIEKMIGGTNQ